MEYLVLGVVAGLAAIERKGFLQAMLSRPIALGPITGALLGDATTGLFVGAPLELLWLGAINMGASLPVHEALGTATASGVAVLCLRALRGSAPGPDAAVSAAVAVLAVALAAPVASFGRAADRAIERWNEHLYARAERDLVAGDATAAARVNLLGVLWPFAMAFALAPLAAALGAALVAATVTAVPAVIPPLAVGWLAFCGFACASGARTMRSRRAPAAFLGATAVAAALVAVRLLGGAA